MSELVIPVERLIEPVEATTLVGTYVGDSLAPTVASPADGSTVRLVDGDATVALITRLDPEFKRQLRGMLNGLEIGNAVARHGFTSAGITFGYAPRKVIVRQEGCRATKLAREQVDAERLLDDLARQLGDEFATLIPEQAQRDRQVIDNSILSEWRLEDSTWTSGIINKSSVLPYHRDGNNLSTWSAMPTIRYATTGGYLHVPEYGIVFPCGDGDVTWFYGRGLVHGVTPIKPRRKDSYRYSIVYYALKGMTDCATFATETTRAAARRTERERSQAAKVRAQVGLRPG
jgi:hypothetical protein